MLNHKPSIPLFLIGLVVLSGLGFLPVGCKSGTQGDQNPAAQTQETAPTGELAKGRSQLWTENCMRCHNIRPPEAYSDSEWAVIVHQMRVRGSLTAQEHKAILELMQASN